MGTGYLNRIRLIRFECGAGILARDNSLIRLMVE